MNPPTASGVYSDGSCIDGRVGAAAVLFRDGQRKRSLRKYLGKENHHTVFEAELVGMCLGVELLRTERNVNMASINIGSQAALQSTQNNKPGSGKHLVDSLIKDFSVLKKRHTRAKLEVNWVPGHAGIRGNEVMDKEAKAA
ncbi:ribonuclease H-like protein, partial [Ramaria rubella]